MNAGEFGYVLLSARVITARVLLPVWPAMKSESCNNKVNDVQKAGSLIIWSSGLCCCLVWRGAQYCFGARCKLDFSSRPLCLKPETTVGNACLAVVGVLGPFAGAVCVNAGGCMRALTGVLAATFT